ncbi:hypothetical protein BDN71DRAFT_1481863 [Pleurotus eryngii]|uniref:Uncharacterized protein n=1 Tax=Pleurotus eryngii TaxID=5323 RepID=A0A9P6A4Z3_PLEER|nr:hypothetical protein BDN71DRAFT_1481863 [Pleurotus eryngii]
MDRSLNIKETNVPGTEEKLVANLFTDNTTMFLDGGSDFAKLQSIIDKWCITAVREQKMNPGHQEIPRVMKIVPNGELIRILGAWIGNNRNQESPWTPVVKVIDRDFKRKLIIQMVVGGQTQYLAIVQGMPKQIEDNLRKHMRKFFWRDKRSPIQEETIFAPAGKGGQGVLDICARNKAIQVSRTI